jgi:hypothetical protein
MIHIPKAQEVINRDGNIATKKSEENNGETDDDEEETDRWRKYCARCFSQ